MNPGSGNIVSTFVYYIYIYINSRKAFLYLAVYSSITEVCDYDVILYSKHTIIIIIIIKIKIIIINIKIIISLCRFHAFLSQNRIIIIMKHQ